MSPSTKRYCTTVLVSPQCYPGADEPRDTTPLRASLKPPMLLHGSLTRWDAVGMPLDQWRLISEPFNGGLDGLAMSTPNGSQGSSKRLEPAPGTSQYGKPSSDVTYLGAGLCPNASCPTGCCAATQQYIYELIL